MTPHPQRCETCQKWYCHFHPNNNFWKPSPHFLELIGCASNSSAENEEKEWGDDFMKFQEQEIRKDEREQWKKGILKFAEEDPLLMAYSDGYKAGKKEEREKVLDEIKEIIDDAISGLYKGTEDPYSAHARHKAFSWVNMKIEELRKGEP